MKKGLSEIICIIDKSGSMGSIANDAVGGFNTFLEEQKALEGIANLTLVLFDTEYKMMYENEPINNVKLLDHQSYRPSGMTALLDAVGKTIDDVGRRLNNTPEENKPEKIIVAILTDGEENSSRQFKLQDIKEKITHQKDNYKWEFIFLGANQDAFAEAAKIGINSIDTYSFQSTGKGVRTAYNTLSQSVTSYRT